MPSDPSPHRAAGPPATESATAFHQRGEAAWQEYLRTGYAVPAEQVFARIQAMFDAKRAALAAQLKST